MDTANKITELIKFTHKLNLLFVEDSKDVREQTTKFLEMFFQKITVCENGQEALDSFKNIEYDIIITDLNMPVLSGIDMIKEIRKTNSEIPILILSAHNEKHIISEANSYNINGYIIKPIDIDNYIEILLKIRDLNSKES